MKLLFLFAFVVVVVVVSGGGSSSNGVFCVKHRVAP